MNNCASNPQQVSVFVNQPSALVSNTNIISNSSCSGTQSAANGEAQVIVSGGTPGYSYNWSNGANTDDTGDGGTAGKAIDRSTNVSVSGIINSNTVKGTY